MQIYRNTPQRVNTVLWAAIFSLGLAGCSKAPTAQQLVAQAQEFHKKGENKAAVIELKNALQLNGNDVAARLMLGRIYLETTDPVSGESELRKAMALGAPVAQTLPLLSKALLAQGKFELVLTETQAASDQGQAGPDLLSRRGDAYLALDKLPEAEAAFKAALQKEAAYADATTGLGRVAAQRRNMEEANRLAQQAVSNHPDDAEAWLFKGDLARAQLQFDAANVAYDHVVAIDGQHVPARLQKAYLDIVAHRFDAAKVELDILRKNAPGNLLVTYTQALLDFTQGKPAAALEPLQQVLKAAPEHMPTLLLLGATQFQLGAMAQAEQHLHKFLDANPHNLYARKMLASTLLATGRAEDAVALIEPNLANATDVQLLTIAGSAYMETRRFPRARETLEQAVKLTPGNASLRVTLGLSMLSMGERDAALAEMAQAAKIAPDSLPVGIVLAMTQLTLKRDDAALATVNALEQAHPKDPTLLNLKGAVYREQGKLPQARASFEKALAAQGDYFPAAANLAALDAQEKHPELAGQRYTAFLAKNKNNVEAMDALAALAQAQGRTAEATQWLERAAAVDPNAVKPAMRLGAQYLASNEKAKALTLARRMQVARPGDNDVLDLLAIAQLGNDDLAGALESYNQLALARPRSAAIQNRLGAIYLAMHNPSAAGDALRKAVQLQPAFPEAQLALANLLISQERTDQAVAIARQLQKQLPASPLGFALEGDALLAAKKAAEAIAPYERATGLSKNSQLFIQLCLALQQAGKPAEAASRLAAWRRSNPEDLAVALRQGEFFVAQGNYPEAAQQFEFVLKRLPGNGTALNDLAFTYQQMKDPRALATAEQALIHSSGSPTVKDTLGWILVEQGDAVRGLPLLQDAVKEKPDSTDIRYHLATALVKTNNHAAARKELEYLLTNHRGFPQQESARTLLKQL